MGIFTEKFAEDQNILDIFMCPICHDIVQDPCVPQCVCQAIYCRVCIDTWLRDHQICPHCESSSIRNIKPMGRILQEAYLNLKMKCETPECDAAVTIRNHVEHKESCPKIPWICTESCGLEANMSVKAGHHCIDWLKEERVRLINDLAKEQAKCVDLESELKDEIELKKEIEQIVQAKTELIESIREDHETEVEKLKEEVRHVRKLLVKANLERDQIHLQLDELKNEQRNNIAKTAATSSIFSDDRNDQEETSHTKDDLKPFSLENALKQMVSQLSETSDTGKGQQFGCNGVREQKSSVESTKGDMLYTRSFGRTKNPTYQKSENPKVVNFERITLANDDIKSKVTSAVNEADSKGLRGVNFKTEIARTMSKLSPTHNCQWACYTKDSFDVNRAKLKPETFCAFNFDSVTYYVYQRIWLPDPPKKRNH